jgi:hypothetical protein
MAQFFYNKMATEIRTGNGLEFKALQLRVLRNEDVQPEQKSTPIWLESLDSLHPAQLIAADIAFTTHLVKTVFKDATDSLPAYLGETRDKTDTKELVTKHAFGMLDLYLAREQGTQAVERFERQWGSEGHFIEGRVTALSEELGLKRDEIYAEAAVWSPSDVRKIHREAHATVAKVPKDLEQHFFTMIPDNADGERPITPETFGAKAKREVSTGAINLGTAFGFDIACGAVGTYVATQSVAGVDLNIMSGMDQKEMLATLAVSYAMWLKGGIKNAQATWNLLEDRDESASFPARRAYYFAKAHTNNEFLQKAATHTGFWFFRIGMEIPYYTHAFVLEQLSSGNNTGAMMLAGANVAAGVLHEVQGRLTDVYRNRRNVQNERDLSAYKVPQSTPTVIPLSAEIG